MKEAYTLTNDEIQLINLLETQTGAKATDVVVTSSEVIFVVKKGDLGKAVGRKGSNIMRLQKAFDKKIEVIEEASDSIGLLANILHPVKARAVEASNSGDKKTLVVSVDQKEKGLAIGRNGEKIKRAKLLSKRYYGIDDVKIV